MVKPPIINAVSLSKIKLLIPAKRQNGRATRKRLKSMEYGVCESAIKSAGSKMYGIKRPGVYLLNETTVTIKTAAANNLTSGLRR
jgi:hypothetical protein